MSAWLDPLRTALDEAPAPVVFFFRDDDAGWCDDRLHGILDVFEAAGAPIDLATIPRAVSPALGLALAARRRANPGLVCVHQHGLAHANHERSGRKCEFGPSRTALLQLADILLGRRLLLELLEAEPDPIFTPPWNRCTVDTARAARNAGLVVLSREARARPLGVEGVHELPVSVDWLRRRRGLRTTREELAEELAAAARGAAPTGVMLHHAVMDGDDRRAVAQLLALLRSSPAARLATMSELVAESSLAA